MLRVLELLRGIDTVFAAASPAYKNRILRAVFPEGFTIHEGEKVRTPCVNQIIAELCGESTVYNLVTFTLKNNYDNKRYYFGT